MPPARLAGLVAALLVALQASTQTFAWLYRYHVTLGPALRLDETGVYWPWMILVWRQRFGAAEGDAFALPLSVFMLVMAAGAGGLLLFDGGAVKSNSPASTTISTLFHSLGGLAASIFAACKSYRSPALC